MANKNKQSTAFNILPELPTVLAKFTALVQSSHVSAEKIDEISLKYPLIFNRLLQSINQGQIVLPKKVDSIVEVIELGYANQMLDLFRIIVIHITFSQYKIKAIDPQDIWQDSFRRATCAKILSAYMGLDNNQCFLAAFIQSTGLFVLFLNQPNKISLWSELRKRDPNARLLMEQNVFNLDHINAAAMFSQQWGLSNTTQSETCIHQIDRDKSNNTKKYMDEILYCANWLSSIFIAEDKSFVIDRSRKMLIDKLRLSDSQIEIIFSSIALKVDKVSRAFDLNFSPRIEFSKILLAANYKLLSDNQDVQELRSRLVSALNERDSLSAELNNELELAREIQKSLLPEISREGFPFCGLNIPAKDLSGDFYDFFERDDGRIYFNLGDVSGKGINASLLMAKASSLFRCLGKRIEKPSELLFQINNELCETNINGMFVTMVAGIYDPSTDVIDIVNAGNPPALLFTPDGIAREIEAQAPPLGIISNIEFLYESLILNDQSLYVFSDGVTEGCLDNGDVLELSGLYKLIANMKKGLPAQEKIQIIADKIQATDNSLRDDVTIVLLENIK